MPVPHTATNFPDLLDPRFERIFNKEYTAEESYIGRIYDNVGSNGRNNMTYSSVSTIGNFTPFGGSVNYQDQTQGYDVTITPLEFVNGFMLERRLFDDDQHHIWDASPKKLGRSAFRTREEDAARMFNNAFSVDTLFYVNSEGVALCSNSHTTTTGASTATGFDNLITSELTAVGVATARIQMRGFVGTQGERISVRPDTLIYPKELYEQAHEIINSPGKLETANNNANVHEGRYEGIEWQYLTDTNNWFMADSSMMKDNFKWTDRIALEYGFSEDFDTFTAKYRAYMRYAMGWIDWRGILGALVS